MDIDYNDKGVGYVIQVPLLCRLFWVELGIYLLYGRPYVLAASKLFLLIFINISALPLSKLVGTCLERIFT